MYIPTGSPTNPGDPEPERPADPDAGRPSERYGRDLSSDRPRPSAKC
jgi:hypothetical protein